jgi:hypothetical protein
MSFAGVVNGWGPRPTADAEVHYKNTDDSREKV